MKLEQSANLVFQVTPYLDLLATSIQIVILIVLVLFAQISSNLFKDNVQPVLPPLLTA
jgi:hypothetical protein